MKSFMKNVFPFLVRACKIRPLDSCHVHNRILLPVVVLPYMGFLDFLILTVASLFHLTYIFLLLYLTLPLLFLAVETTILFTSIYSFIF